MTIFAVSQSTTRAPYILLTFLIWATLFLLNINTKTNSKHHVSYIMYQVLFKKLGKFNYQYLTNFTGEKIKTQMLSNFAHSYLSEI